MGTLNAFYVRATDDRAIVAIGRLFPSTDLESGKDFVSVTLASDAFDPPAKPLADLSKELATDVIWLGFQSSVDAFQFHRWHAGTLLRSLVFGCYVEERTWEKVEGEAEPWEQAAFFDPKLLRHLLESAQSEEERREFNRIWEEAELLPGRTEPNIDARESARAVAEHYHFPGWS